MPTNIHPTAIVHPEAQLGEGVEIGPYAVIEGPASIGPRCRIAAHAIITGHVTMGSDNQIGHGAILGADPQDNAFDPATESRVEIGSHNRIREYATLHRGTAAGSATRVGDHCFLMAGTHLGHNAVVGDRVIIANNSLLGGHVVVEDNVFIGGGCVFHQFVRLGRNSIIQGLSALSKDVPPFLIACRRNRVAGLNSIGLRRSGLSRQQRGEIKEAFRLLYKSGLNTAQALEEARKREWGAEGSEFFQFVANAKKRGICDDLRGRHGSPDEGEDDAG